MPTIISLFLLVACPMVNAQSVTSRSAQDAEIRELAGNITQMLSTMMQGSEKDGIQELQKKLALVKSIKKEMGEENLKRFELMEELRTVQMGLQYFGYRHGNDSSGGEARLNALKKIEKALETSVDPQQLKINKEKAESGRIKGALSSLRSAIQIFYGDKEGVFPNDLSELTEKSKYITQIPYNMPPGHEKKSNSVKIVSGVRTMEELIPKINDAGGWLYVNDKSSPMWGTIIINCTHKDVGRDTYMYSY